MSAIEQPQAILFLFSIEDEAFAVSTETEKHSAIEEMGKSDECRNVPGRVSATGLHSLGPRRAIGIRLRECDRAHLVIRLNDAHDTTLQEREQGLLRHVRY